MPAVMGWPIAERDAARGNLEDAKALAAELERVLRSAHDWLVNDDQGAADCAEDAVNGMGDVAGNIQGAMDPVERQRESLTVELTQKQLDDAAAGNFRLAMLDLHLLKGNPEAAERWLRVAREYFNRADAASQERAYARG